jgi:molecular chaperone DnaK
MVKEAEKYASDDVKKKEEVELINQADTLVYQTEKALKDYGDKVDQAERANIESSLNELKSAIKDKNINRIKSGMDAVTKASHKLAEEIYKASTAKQSSSGGAEAHAGGEQAQSAGPQQGQEQPGSQQAKGGKDDAIDAEFKEK